MSFLLDTIKRKTDTATHLSPPPPPDTQPYQNKEKSQSGTVLLLCCMLVKIKLLKCLSNSLFSNMKFLLEHWEGTMKGFHLK